jgi:hypothetical protein
VPALLEEGELDAESHALATVLRAWAHYRQGFLPCIGGTLDQPWFLLRCLEACEGARMESEAEQHEAAKASREEQSVTPRRARVRRLSE